MAKAVKNDEKRRENLKKGVRFSSDTQPPPNAKSDGWKELRAKRLLTQQIIAEMTGQEGKNLKGYVKSLLENAMQGNAKAIETINKCMEDDIIKVAQTDSEGNDIDLSKYTDEELRTIAELQRKGRISEA